MGRIPEGVKSNWIDKEEAVREGWQIYVADAIVEEPGNAQFGPQLIYKGTVFGKEVIFGLPASDARREQADAIDKVINAEGGLYLRLAKKGRAYDLQEVEDPSLPF